MDAANSEPARPQTHDDDVLLATRLEAFKMLSTFVPEVGAFRDPTTLAAASDHATDPPEPIGLYSTPDWHSERDERISTTGEAVCDASSTGEYKISVSLHGS